MKCNAQILLVHGTSLQARFKGLLSKSLWEQESPRSSNVDQLSADSRVLQQIRLCSTVSPYLGELPT